jgi:hypothetical protein
MHFCIPLTAGRARMFFFEKKNQKIFARLLARFRLVGLRPS